MSSFQPCAVVELTVEPGRGLRDIRGLDGYEHARVLVRLEGKPVGWISVPVEGGRCDADLLSRQIRRSHEDAVVRHLLARSLVGVAPGEPVAPLPSLTVAVCTRDRAEDLDRCLQALGGADYPGLDVLVVDNAPPDDQTRRLVDRVYAGRVRYVREDRAGLSWARRRAVAECSSDIIAFLDDDERADRAWPRAIADVFAANPDVMTVLGLVAPMELESPAQEWFEQHGGFGRGFERRWLRRGSDQEAAPALANTGTFGTGANMAFRRVVFDEVGGFDPVLGAGTPTEGGEDLDMIFRVLEARHTVVYEPGALTWHRHRRGVAELRRQARSWGRGMVAYLMRSWQRHPDERRGLARLLVALLAVYYPRRVAQSLGGRRVRFDLAVAELYGAVTAPFICWSQMRTARIVARTGGASAAPVSAAGARAVQTSAGTAAIELTAPVPHQLSNADGADVLQVTVTRAGTALGVVSIVAGGQAVSRQRLVDAVIAQIDTRLLDDCGDVRDQIPTVLASAPAS